MDTITGPKHTTLTKCNGEDVFTLNYNYKTFKYEIDSFSTLEIELDYELTNNHPDTNCDDF